MHELIDKIIYIDDKDENYNFVQDKNKDPHYDELIIKIGSTLDHVVIKSVTLNEKVKDFDVANVELKDNLNISINYKFVDDIYNPKGKEWRVEYKLNTYK